MVFNTTAWPVSYFTGDLEVIEHALKGVLKLRYRGGTAIREAVYEAANRFIWFDDREDPCRRAVLVITDNMGRPTRSERSAVENLWEANALLSGLIVSNHAANISLPGLLAPLGVKRKGGIGGSVEKTAGDIISSNDLGSSFPEMIHRIRSRYSLYYRFPEGKPGAVRNVRVELSGQGQEHFHRRMSLLGRATRSATLTSVPDSPGVELRGTTIASSRRRNPAGLIKSLQNVRLLDCPASKVARLCLVQWRRG